MNDNQDNFHKLIIVSKTNHGSCCGISDFSVSPASFPFQTQPLLHQAKVPVICPTTFSALGMHTSASPPGKESLPVTEITLNLAELNRIEKVLLTSFEHLVSTVPEINSQMLQLCDSIHPLPSTLFFFFCLNLSLSLAMEAWMIQKSIIIRSDSSLYDAYFTHANLDT